MGCGQSNDTSSTSKYASAPAMAAARRRDVFISYAHAANRQLVTKLNRRLRTDGLACWCDEDDIRSANVIDAMAQGIEECVCFLMCYDKAYGERKSCAEEAAYARKLGKEVFPVLLEDRFRPSGWLGFMLGERFYYNFSGKYDFETIYPKLVADLRAHIEEASNGGGNGVTTTLDSSPTRIPIGGEKHKGNEPSEMGRCVKSARVRRASNATSIAFQHEYITADVSSNADGLCSVFRATEDAVQSLTFTEDIPGELMVYPQDSGRNPTIRCDLWLKQTMDQNFQSIQPRPIQTVVNVALPFDFFFTTPTNVMRIPSGNMKPLVDQLVKLRVQDSIERFSVVTSLFQQCDADLEGFHPIVVASYTSSGHSKHVILFDAHYSAKGKRSRATHCDRQLERATLKGRCTGVVSSPADHSIITVKSQESLNKYTTKLTPVWSLTGAFEANIAVGSLDGLVYAQKGSSILVVDKEGTTLNQLLVVDDCLIKSLAVSKYGLLAIAVVHLSSKKSLSEGNCEINTYLLEKLFLIAGLVTRVTARHKEAAPLLVSFVSRGNNKAIDRNRSPSQASAISNASATSDTIKVDPEVERLVRQQMAAIQAAGGGTLKVPTTVDPKMVEKAMQKILAEQNITDKTVLIDSIKK